MALTGDELLRGFSERIGDYWTSAATSAGSDGTTLTDTALRRFGDDELTGGYVRIVEAGDANVNAIRRVSDASGSGLTFAPGFDNVIGIGDDYEYHKFDPVSKWRALDRARMLCYPQLSILRIDETLTGDGQNTELDIPATMRKGPVIVLEEDPLDPRAGWNALGNPELTSLASTWTASGATASLYGRADYDLLVPKREQNCVKLVGSGTYRQTVGSMRVTAAQAAGRRVTFGMWVYQRASAGTATVHIVHDTATVTSSTHGGGGWELLTVTATIPSGNATLLTVGVTTGGSVTVFVEHAFMTLGDRLPHRFPTVIGRRGIQRDDSRGRVMLSRRPRQGYQLRLVGRAPLSALGTDIEDQRTNTMEIDEFGAQLLYARAARVLLIERGWTASAIEDAYPFIKEVEAEWDAIEPDWSMDLPYEPKLDGWWNDTNGG